MIAPKLENLVQQEVKFLESQIHEQSKSFNERLKKKIDQMLKLSMEELEKNKEAGSIAPVLNHAALDQSNIGSGPASNLTSPASNTAISASIVSDQDFLTQEGEDDRIAEQELEFLDSFSTSCTVPEDLVTSEVYRLINWWQEN